METTVELNTAISAEIATQPDSDDKEPDNGDKEPRLESQEPGPLVSIPTEETVSTAVSSEPSNEEDLPGEESQMYSEKIQAAIEEADASKPDSSAGKVPRQPFRNLQLERGTSEVTPAAFFASSSQLSGR